VVRIATGEEIIPPPPDADRLWGPTQSQWRTQEFCWGGGGLTNSVEDRGQTERGSGGCSPLVRGSGGSCNWYKKFHFIW
jgi:hypothetical protein